jgi:hypothetical protein
LRVLCCYCARTRNVSDALSQGRIRHSESSADGPPTRAPTVAGPVHGLLCQVGETASLVTFLNTGLCERNRTRSLGNLGVLSGYGNPVGFRAVRGHWDHNNGQGGMIRDAVRGVAEQRVTSRPVVAASPDDDEVGVVLLREPKKVRRRVPTHQLGGMAHAMFPQDLGPLADKFGAPLGDQLVGLQLECIELDQPALWHDMNRKNLRVQGPRQVGRPAQCMLGAIRTINTDGYALDCHPLTISRGQARLTTAAFSRPQWCRGSCS